MSLDTCFLLFETFRSHFQLQSIVVCLVIVLYIIIGHYKHSALMVYKWKVLFEWMLLVQKHVRRWAELGRFICSVNQRVQTACCVWLRVCRRKLFGLINSHSPNNNVTEDCGSTRLRQTDTDSTKQSNSFLVLIALSIFYKSRFSMNTVHLVSHK